MKSRVLGLIALFCSAALPCCALAEDGVDFAPFYESGTDVFGNRRWRALGPILESRQSEKGNELFAIRPLYSFMSDPAENLYRRQVLYPLLMAKGIGSEWDWHFALLFSYHDFDVNDPFSKYRLWLVPVYFQGRDAEGVPYMAIFPFAGSIREFIVFDEVRFAMFPLAFYTRVNDVKTTSMAWPFFSRTTGGGNDRLVAFPFYGRSRLREESDKYFVLWPFWTHARYSLPQSPGSAWIAFPFYGQVSLENQHSCMFVPPLFRYARGVDREGVEKTMIHWPWPFIQYASGPVNKLYFWPLWGRSQRDTNKTEFFMWPLAFHYSREAPFYAYDRYVLFPVFYATSTRGSFDDPERKMDQPRRTVKVWPLFSNVSDADRSRFAMLSLFPYRDYDAIERNYGALWTLFTYSVAADRREAELLWGLARYRESAEERKFSLFPLVSVARENRSGHFHWSFLKGLIAREKAGDERRFRLLYFITF